MKAAGSILTLVIVLAIIWFVMKSQFASGAHGRAASQGSDRRGGREERSAGHRAGREDLHGEPRRLCRLFLSTDSGSVGLNLQAASAVINIDLPWNPAKLEQRIARAWRKNQTRSVSVINLVTEGSIEHSILHLLGQKQALADGLLDGEGDLSALKMPSGRGAFIERMQAMMAAPARSAPRLVSPEEEFVADLVRRLGESVALVELRGNSEGRPSLLTVLDLDRDALAAERERASGALPVEFIDKAAWLAMRRLAASGLLQFHA